MKKNMSRTMDRLEIDEGIRPVISALWKHCEETMYCCSGHGIDQAYVMIKDGKNSWFGDNCDKYNFEKVPNEWNCCRDTIQSAILDAKDYGVEVENIMNYTNCCPDCGGGLNGKSVYRSINILE